MKTRRKTENKKRILSVFKKAHTASAVEIQGCLPDIDPSTIYRNLKRFVADGVLREVLVGDGNRSYELCEETHEHFICKRCKEVQSMFWDSKLLSRALPKGVAAESCDVTVMGVCGKCA